MVSELLMEVAMGGKRWWSVNGHSNILVELVKEKNIKKMAEIGVFKGKTTRIILRNCGDILEEYWGVDKYNTEWIMEGKTYTFPKQTAEKWYEMYKGVCKYMPFFPQLKLLKMDSAEAVELFPKKFFPDGYFDFVYIDADHTYEMVKKDIELWLPLIKKGGIIGGHDYDFPEEAAGWGGVKRAVDEMFKPDQLKIYKVEGVWLANL